MSKVTHLSTVRAIVELPRLPNFIRLHEGAMLPIDAFSEEELRALGAAWTDALVAKAKGEIGENE